MNTSNRSFLGLCLTGALTAACGSIVPVPVPDSVAISPENPRTTDDLVAVIGADDPESYQLRWYQDEVERADLTADTVASGQTRKHESWRVDLIDAGGAVVASDQVIIANTPPSEPVISVPEIVTAGESVQCVIVAPAVDPDDDAIEYSATWERNGAPLGDTLTREFSGDTVPPDTVESNDVLVCIVTASDGDAQTAVPSNATCPALGPTTFGFTGASQSYVVPWCATGVTIEVRGAQGGGPLGGNGGYARGSMSVDPGQTLTVMVGGRNGFNGGGTGIGAQQAHGGGASDVRTASDLASRVIVAGGGGGGINGDGPYTGGAGGGGQCGANYCGGAGGAGYGGAGGSGGLTGGAGITNNAHAGGAGGAGVQTGGQPSCQTYNSPPTCGTAGTLGQGGNGGPYVQEICATQYGATSGGGGGYYGGGGTAVGYCGGGAGGGGSSWTGNLAGPSLLAGVNAGDGRVVITPY